jgi:alkanesulfonate monooxygenase SsuD/methylene tetrahydromethanopterin reductase-like flavin-dependent oxidoreductase (luciferase family)
MAGIAAATSRVKIGSIVFGNTYRHPAILANEVATIDQMSGGRVTLGIGAGWQENEHAAYGIELPPVKERLDRFEEAVQVIKGLLTEEHFSFSGDHYTITNAPMNPKRADMPILIGGGGEKRTMKIAAKYADEWNIWSTPEIMKPKLDILRKHCDDVGRSFDDIHVSTQALLFMSDDESFLENMRNNQLPMAAMIGTPKELGETMQEYVDLGVDELLIPSFTLPPAGAARNDYLDRFFTEVVAPFHA